MKQTPRLMSSLLAAMTALVFVMDAQAQSSNSSNMMTARRTSYIGLSAGQTDFTLDSGSGLFGSEKRDTVYSLYAGSYFSNNFGVEFGYTDFGRINRAGGSTKADGVNLSVVGKLPLSDSFNLLGKIGTTYSRTEVSSAAGSGITAGTENDFGWTYGVGAEFAFTPQWSMTLQYDEHNLKYPGGNRDRLNVTTLGARYYF